MPKTQDATKEDSGGVSAAVDPIEHPSGGEHGFTFVSAREIPLLGVTLQHWRHEHGAEHYHLAKDDPHRAFTVAFRTIPSDSTGVPHILEHVVLCGSERYPVRDPFFLMLRRSLQTFMNAMTGADCTYYPFASQVEKDFFNLLDIYLDATFRPNLNPLDFAQEGHRLERAGTVPGNPNGNGGRSNGKQDGDPVADSRWVFKGVVYNEMKGAMGNADAQMSDARSRHLVPNTPYHHNSGGDPAAIPSLTYDNLVAFHRTHYAGANACFVTYGDLDPMELHRRFAPYLEERPGERIPLPPAQPRMERPLERDVPVPLQVGQDERDVSIASVTWLLRGDTRNVEDVLLAELTEHLLAGHAGAPLRHALESSGLGRALGRTGYGNFGTDPAFTVTLKGMDPADYDRFLPLVLDTLRDVRNRGFPDEEIEAALHQVELDRRTISGDRFPFGLELAVGRVVEAWRQGSDPYELLDDEAAISALRERVQGPEFWQRTLDQWFLDNPHRLLLLAHPDAEFNADRERAERELLEALTREMDDDQRAELDERAERLAERQEEEDDVSVLPELMLSDIPESTPWVERRTPEPGMDTIVTATNGVLHQIAALPLGSLSKRDLELLPLLAGSIGKLGVGEHGYAEWSAHLNAVCGGISGWLDLRVAPDDADTTRGFLFLETRGLARRSEDFADLLTRTLRDQRFDELARMREIIEQGVVGYQQQVAWSGHVLAQRAAMRGFGGRAGLAHDMSGLGRLAWLKGVLAREAEHGNEIEQLAAELTDLRTRIASRPVRVGLIGDAASEPDVQAAARSAWDGWQRPASFEAELSRTDLPSARPTGPRAYTTATQVNYCAMAFPAVPMEQEHAAALAVGARYLAFNHLHNRIREKGGAYGSRATYSSSMSVFGMSSYRDPRLVGTYEDMVDGLRWMTTLDDDERLLRESILRTIAGIDRPRSPSGEGRRRFVADLVGYGPDVINAFRSRVLSTTTGDLRRAAEQHLDPGTASRAAITSDDTMDESNLDWERESIA